MADCPPFRPFPADGVMIETSSSGLILEAEARFRSALAVGREEALAPDIERRE
jgi:hypothetical protein